MPLVNILAFALCIVLAVFSIIVILLLAKINNQAKQLNKNDLRIKALLNRLERHV